MKKNQTRYSELAPFNNGDQCQLTVLAIQFFSPNNYPKMCEILDRPALNHIGAFGTMDFLSYLTKIGKFTDSLKFMFLIRDLLNHLVRKDILTEVGDSKDRLSGKLYYFFKELTEMEKKGLLWLSLALGPEFIYKSYSKVSLHLIGKKESGDIYAGTGIAITPKWILTCAHVVKDMILEENQTFHDKNYKVKRTIAHDKIDVALIQVDNDLPTLSDLAFRDPVISETVYTLGYPRVPLSRNEAIVMQRGEVTNSDIILFSGDEVFLYSAIARPGNSGGPIISDNGHVVGIVTDELSEEALNRGMAFYAGLRASEIKKAIHEMEPTVILPIENYK